MLVAIAKSSFDEMVDKVKADDIAPGAFICGAKSKSQLRRHCAQQGLARDEYKILAVKEAK